jgi:cell division protein FtsB
MDRSLKKQLKPILSSTIVFAVIAYFVYNIIQGDRGLIAMLRLFKQIGESQEVLAQIEEQNKTLNNRIDLLRPSHLSEDMLDEQVRQQLGYVAGEDIIVLQDQIFEDSQKK